MKEALERERERFWFKTFWLLHMFDIHMHVFVRVFILMSVLSFCVYLYIVLTHHHVPLPLYRGVFLVSSPSLRFYISYFFMYYPISHLMQELYI